MTEIDSMRFHKKYRIVKSLGKGNFGEVLKVMSKQDGKVYAAKKFFHKIQDPHNEERLQRFNL